MLAATDISVTAGDHTPAEHPGSSHQGCVWLAAAAAVHRLYLQSTCTLTDYARVGQMICRWEERRSGGLLLASARINIKNSTEWIAGPLSTQHDERRVTRLHRGLYDVRPRGFPIDVGCHTAQYSLVYRRSSEFDTMGTLCGDILGGQEDKPSLKFGFRRDKGVK